MRLANLPMDSNRIKNVISNEYLLVLCLIAICILCLVPFIHKAFNIDDPVFIWVAEHIRTNPFDFYGFMVNWNGFNMPMSIKNQNPPVVSYYIALVAPLFGWSETGLHLAFLFPAIAVVIGTYCLARQLCSHAFTATLLSMTAPVFIVSSTTIMSDIMMLALWCFAVLWWFKAMETNDRIYFILSSLFIAVASLTKYFGIGLIPLLFLYTLAKKRKLGKWTLFLFFPILVLVFYQLMTQMMYGKGLLRNVAEYATLSRQIAARSIVVKVLTGLVFIGGCYIGMLFCSVFLWGKQTFSLFSAGVAILVLALYSIKSIGGFPIVSIDGTDWIFVAQFALLAFAGANFLAMVVKDLLKSKDSESLILFLWATGTALFACFINWSVNGRSVLPLVPVFGILLVRHFERSGRMKSSRSRWRLSVAVSFSLIVALLVARADYRFADSARQAAVRIGHTYRNFAGTVWFQGHWGFQYYMERFGGKAFDFRASRLRIGDLMIIPSNNARVLGMPKEFVDTIQELSFETDRFLTLMDPKAGAGFYSDMVGLLPFSLRPRTQERYYVLQVIR